MNIEKLIAVLAFCFYFTFCFSYNKENHALITQAAIDLLRLEYGPEFIPDKVAKDIIKGNVSEDNFGFKWITRLWNQHFYNPTKSEDIRRNAKSINDRFNRLAKRCLSDKVSKKYYKRLGEVIHHIQDVTVPAHVVPVFHGGCCIKDAFDEQDLNTYLKSRPEINSSYTHDQSNNLSILDPVAIETLNNLNDKFNIEIKEPGKPVKSIYGDWSLFWKSSSYDWFGEYGKLGYPNGKKGGFKDNFLEPFITVNQVEYAITENEYQVLIQKQVSLAIKATAEFIYYAMNRKSNSSNSK